MKKTRKPPKPRPFAVVKARKVDGFQWWRVNVIRGEHHTFTYENKSVAEKVAEKLNAAAEEWHNARREQEGHHGKK